MNPIPGHATPSISSGQPTHVVTAFLLRADRGKAEILLVRRSERVRTYRGAWAGVSGYLEPGVTPLEQAYTELREEVALPAEAVQLLREGEPLDVRDEAQGLAWVVHPFLFALPQPDRIHTDWEASEHRWVTPDELARLPTVPMLAEALARVYPEDME
ncbi:MAG TPA: NUDIX domain-containing protein [Ktedonobacterales bacterium]